MEGSWLSESCIYSINPMDPDRKIYHFHCSTHNQKSTRNSLHRSQVGGTRNFHRLKKYETGDENVVRAIYKVDEADEKVVGAAAVRMEHSGEKSVGLAVARSC
jgi:hypothetical protein